MILYILLILTLLPAIICINNTIVINEIYRTIQNRLVVLSQTDTLGNVNISQYDAKEEPKMFQKVQTLLTGQEVIFITMNIA